MSEDKNPEIIGNITPSVTEAMSTEAGRRAMARQEAVRQELVGDASMADQYRQIQDEIAELRVLAAEDPYDNELQSRMSEKIHELVEAGQWLVRCGFVPPDER